LPQAFVLALGGKAARRMKKGGLRYDAQAHHPSARPANRRGRIADPARCERGRRSPCLHLNSRHRWP
jgi:hypothetical protein